MFDLNHSRAGNSTLGSSKTLNRISLPLLILTNPCLATSIISGVNAFLCLIRVFSTTSINSSEPLPTWATCTRISLNSSKVKYLWSPSSTSFCSTVSQNSLSYKLITDAPSIKCFNDLVQFLSKVASWALHSGRIFYQKPGVLSSCCLAMNQKAYDF